MGAMATLMYIVYTRMKNLPHYLSMAIVLSPAGCHRTAPTLIRLISPIFNLFITIFPNAIYTIKIPDFMKTFVTKLIEDMNRNYSSRILLSYIARMLVGGNKDDMIHALIRMHNLAMNTGGTSVKVFKHFYQIYRNQKFEAYDYGPRINNEQYGQPDPIDFFENYDKIDIPIWFAMGLLDTLITPKCVITHYATLLKKHRDKPELANLKAFPGIGHVDFTVGEKSAVTNFILKTLRQHYV